MGLKNFVLTTSTGTILDFEIYQGTTTNFSNRELGFGPAVIPRLVDTIPKENFIFFDKYFTTIPLLNKLIELDIFGTGTIMSNRVQDFDMKSDNDMKRGDSDEFVRTDKKISITKWMDSRSGLMCSTAYGSQPTTPVRRWESSKKERVEVPCPKVVEACNQNILQVFF